MLARVPDAKLSWKPHPKSMTVGGLAQHVANLPSWAAPTFDQNIFFPPADRLPKPQSPREILARFDEASALMRRKLSEATDAAFAAPWTFGTKEKPVFVLPRAAVVRSFLRSHLIHHRGQLSVYLRLLDVPIPGMYGPQCGRAGLVPALEKFNKI